MTQTYSPPVLSWTPIFERGLSGGVAGDEILHVVDDIILVWRKSPFGLSFTPTKSIKSKLINTHLILTANL